MNGLTYCLNNPLSYTDPSGMLREPRPNPSDAGYPYNPEAAAWLADYYAHSYGGGGGGHYGTMGSGYYDVQCYTAEDVLGSIWHDYLGHNPADNVLYSYISVKGDWYNAYTTTIIYPSRQDLWTQGLTASLDYVGMAANGGGSQRELVATGVVTSIMLFAGGGVGIEAGTIKYKGEEYGIVSFAVGGGLDISGGWNFIRIYADPNNFDIYDLEGAGGQGNASFTIIGGSWEAPSSGEQFTDQYRIKSWGWEVGPPIFWGGGSWTHTTTKIIPPSKNPTLYDLYKSRPGGY
jgi:hypothetical protein